MSAYGSHVATVRAGWWCCCELVQRAGADQAYAELEVAGIPPDVAAGLVRRAVIEAGAPPWFAPLTQGQEERQAPAGRIAGGAEDAGAFAVDNAASGGAERGELGRALPTAKPRRLRSFVDGSCDPVSESDNGATPAPTGAVEAEGGTRTTAPGSTKKG